MVSISEGVKCLAQSGLLEHRNAVGLAGALDDRRKRWPGTNWLTNCRYIQDGNTVTTAGVVAAVPMTMALVEAIVGRDKALALGQQIGVSDWSPAHDASGFDASVGYRLNALLGLLSRHESVVIAVTDGVDDLALGLALNPWSRTHRTRVIVTSPRSSFQSGSGLMLMPIDTRSDHVDYRTTVDNTIGARQLAQTIDEITARYGPGATDILRVELEVDQSSPSGM